MLGSRVNVTGTVNVLEAVRRRGDGHGPGGLRVVDRRAAPAAAEYPSTLYGVFKLANEGTAAGYFADFGVSSVGLRPHTLYGPGRDQGLTSAPTAAMVAAAPRRGVRDPVRRLAAAPVLGGRRRGVRARERGAARRARRCTTSTGRWRAVEEIIAAIEPAAPEAAGRITYGEDPLPFPPSVDSSVVRPSSSADRPSRPLEEGVAQAIARVQVSTAPSDAEPTDAA